MISAWTKHLKDPKDVEKFSTALLGDRLILRRLKELLQEEEENLDKLDRSAKAFEDPNWAYKQSYNNGFRACLAMLKKLINLDQKDKQ